MVYISTEKNEIVVFLSTLLCVNLSTESLVTVNSMPSISKQTVFFLPLPHPLCGC